MFKVRISGDKWKTFETMHEANEFCEAVRQASGKILTIESEKPLKPFKAYILFNGGSWNVEHFEAENMDDASEKANEIVQGYRDLGISIETWLVEPGVVDNLRLI